MKFKAEWCSKSRMWHLICPLGGCVYNYRHTTVPHSAAIRHIKFIHNRLLKEG